MPLLARISMWIRRGIYLVGAKQRARGLEVEVGAERKKDRSRKYCFG